MENTNTIKFENDQAEWFVAVGEKYRGPFKASEVYQKLQDKEVSWIDHCFREKEGQWIRIADHEVFKAHQPAPPKPKPTMAPPPIPKVEDHVKWFLFQNENQTGPYGSTELKRLAASGQILEGAYVWQEKYTEWKLVSEVAELREPRSAGAPPLPRTAEKSLSELKPEKRSVPRKPLLAQVYVTNQAELATGICRDISIGGMQLLTDKIPGEVGSSIHLNVTPPKDSGLKPFVAEGVIVRILEDKRGFAFRFTQISADAKKSIESYIA
jgi:hypothetical protein